MPYRVAKSGRCPTSKPWACINADTGEVLGCHTSQPDAQAQVAERSADAARTFSPDEPRDPLTGEWVGDPVSAAKDLLNLAGRIQLADGEQLRSSGRFEPSSGYDVDIVHAVIDTPGGRQIRLGIIPAHDADRWTAANKGGTSVLSPRETAHLRDDLTEASRTAKTAAKATDKIWAAGGSPDISKPVTSGVAKGDWVDISWEVHLTDDDPTSWTVSMQPTRDGTPIDAAADPAVLMAKDIPKFVEQLDGML